MLKIIVMKRYFLPILSILLFFSCSNSKIKTDYKDFEVQGTVRQITYKSLESKNRDVVVRFNKDGMLISERIYGRYFEFKYDDKKVTEVKGFIGDSLDLRRTFTYKHNNPIEIREYDKIGNLRKKTMYQYDDEGNNIGGADLNAYNDTLASQNRTYKNGLVQEETRNIYNEQSIPLSDEDASIKKNKYILAFSTHYKYEYKENNELVSLSEIDDDAIYSKTIYKTYHNLSLPIKTYTYWDNKITDSTTITYGFDEKGNWIFKRSVATHGKEIRQERIITYYK